MFQVFFIMVGIVLFNPAGVSLQSRKETPIHRYILPLQSLFLPYTPLSLPILPYSPLSCYPLLHSPIAIYPPLHSPTLPTIYYAPLYSTLFPPYYLLCYPSLPYTSLCSSIVPTITYAPYSPPCTLFSPMLPILPYAPQSSIHRQCSHIVVLSYPILIDIPHMIPYPPYNPLCSAILSTNLFNPLYSPMLPNPPVRPADNLSALQLKDLLHAELAFSYRG